MAERKVEFNTEEDPTGGRKRKETRVTERKRGKNPFSLPDQLPCSENQGKYHKCEAKQTQQID